MMALRSGGSIALLARAVGSRAVASGLVSLQLASWEG